MALADDERPRRTARRIPTWIAYIACLLLVWSSAGHIRHKFWRVDAGPKLRTEHALLRTGAAVLASLDILHGARPLDIARTKLVLEYETSGGLINQQYEHISLFLLAKAMGAEVIFPPGTCRDSFGPKQRSSKVPAKDIWDIPAIVDEWGKLGVRVHEATPDLLFDQGGSNRDADLHMKVEWKSLYQKTAPLATLVEQGWDHILQCVKNATSTGAGTPSVITMRIPNTFFAVDLSSNREAAAAAAVRLPFASKYHSIANRAMELLASEGKQRFNGAHLRLEQDAIFRADDMGGFDGLLAEYGKYMRAAGFNGTSPLFAASGLINSGADEDWNRTKTFLLDGLSSQVLHKGILVPELELATLSAEQQAILDLLLLLRSEYFIGIGHSTFSLYVVELRALMGYHPNTSYLVKTPDFDNRFGKLYSKAASITGMVTFGLH